MSIVNSIRARRQLKMRQRHPEQPGLRKEQKIQENKGYYPTLKQTCARIFYTFCVPLAVFTGPTKYLSPPTYEMHTGRMVSLIPNLEFRIFTNFIPTSQITFTKKQVKRVCSYG